MNEILENDIDLQQLESLDESTLLRYAFETFGQRAAIGTSLQKTGVVIIDLAHKLEIPYRVFFIDTLENFPETYDLLNEVEQHYGITIERYAPTDQEIHELYTNSGQYAHFLSRARCCHTRKQLPMQRASETLDAWIAGLRVDQSEHRRENARKVGWGYGANARKILKINPLLNWTTEQVDEYTAKNNLPYNKLYDFVSPFNERFTTIGCQACHIPIQEGCDPRAGKFPWEQGQKECGLHQDGGGI